MKNITLKVKYDLFREQLKSTVGYCYIGDYSRFMDGLEESLAGTNTIRVSSYADGIINVLLKSENANKYKLIGMAAELVIDFEDCIKE